MTAKPSQRCNGDSEVLNFSRTSRDLLHQIPKLSRPYSIFKDFPGPGKMKKKISWTFKNFQGRVATLNSADTHTVVSCTADQSDSYTLSLQFTTCCHNIHDWISCRCLTDGLLFRRTCVVVDAQTVCLECRLGERDSQTYTATEVVIVHQLHRKSSQTSATLSLSLSLSLSLL